MAAKGEFEITYFGGPDNPAPCGGVNYSVPYTALPPNDLSPLTVNTQSINGFLCSSPWVAATPYTLNFVGTPIAGEYIIGIWEYTGSLPFTPVTGGITNSSVTLILTNIAVYVASNYAPQSNVLQKASLTLLHTWAPAEINKAFLFPGQCAAFVQVGSFVYITGLMLQGIFFFNGPLSIWGTATTYVTGRFISELAGRLVVAECYFPGGGGTGSLILPTIAWSGVGIYGQTWDLNPAHDVWNPLNQTFFNGNIGGFNLLGDVPDQITGIGLVGQSLIIVRTNGLTQQDPNSTFSNSGLQPYNWYHMWSSAKGVGGVVGSVSQFGQILIFKSSDNVYSLSMSSGLSPLGNKIMGRIEGDLITIGNSPGVYNAGGAGSVTLYINPWWYFSTIYELDGQLHYVLILSTYATNASTSPTSQFTNCFAYDFNMAESSWHIWDFSQYNQQSGTTGATFVGFSCPPSMQFPTIFASSGTTNVSTITNPRLFLIGVYTSYGSVTAAFPLNPGTLMSLVAFDYDIQSPNALVQGGYLSNIYTPIAMPNTVIVFRGEVLALGHKLTVRRMKTLTDNSLLPIAQTGEQFAVVTLEGEKTFQASSPVQVDGNTSFVGQPVRTRFYDVVLADYTVQPSIHTVFTNNPPSWSTMCAFRIASASIIGVDTKSTDQ